MTKKVFDFLSSFGMVLVGVILLFVFSVDFTPMPKKTAQLPRSGVRIFGGDIESNVLPVSRPMVPLAKNKEKFPGKLSAASVLVVDDKTGTTLYGYKPDDVRPLASVTKLMSALVLLDQKIDWTTTTVVTEDDDVESSHSIVAGEEHTAEDLWHIALIGSANSAINSLVRVSGLAPDQFVERMNKKARDLDLMTLHFTEPSGLNSGNVGNARDAAGLLKEALKQEKIKNTLKIGEYYSRPLNKNKARRIWSTNWLLLKWVPNNFNSVQLAGKTGYIVDSGYNFVVKVDDSHGHAVRVVVLGAESGEARFTEARDLAEWAFKHFVWPDQEGYKDRAD